MLRRITFGVLVALTFSLLSCHSKKENRNDAVAVEKPADADFAMMENNLANDSLNLQLRSVLAAKYYAAGQLDKAVYHYLKIYDQDNKNINALNNLGNIYYDSRQDDKAIEFYEKGLAIDSADIDVRCDLATCYSNINKMKTHVDSNSSSSKKKKSSSKKKN